MLKHSTWQKNEKHTNQASDPKMYQKKKKKLPNYKNLPRIYPKTHKYSNSSVFPIHFILNRWKS